jgi:aryl-alcohol dehydrogenase-like predicted oxidoreductase
MTTRRIGNTAFCTPKIALGGVTFGREIDERESFRLLDYAVDSGIILIDTAEAYGGGQARQYRRDVLHIDDERETSGEMHSSEKIIGRWLRATGARDRIVLQTKTLLHGRAEVANAIQRSLERLQTDRIDLYLLHRFNVDVPLEETMEPITEAIRDGRIGAAGCSNATAAQLRSALAISPRFEVTQPPYSLVDREIEAEFLPLCKEENIGVIGYSPLGAGYLTGKYEGAIPKGSRFDVIPAHAGIYFSERNSGIVRRLRALSERVGVPMPGLAMAWALRNPDLTAVLIGARHVGHIDNALDALALDAPEDWFSEMSSWGREVPQTPAAR